MCKARRAARKNRNLRRPAAIFLLQPPKAAKASVKPLSKRSVRAAMAVICLTARDTARRVWMRSAPTGPSKSDVFPRGDTFRRASYRQFFVMHSAIWIFSRLSEQIKQSFCENLYGACRGTPGLRIVFAWVFRYNKYRCCLHKDICKKLDKRLERGAGPPQRGRAA